MVSTKRASSWLAVLAAAVLVLGCSGQKQPAEKAVADIEASLDVLRVDAQELAPIELDRAESALASLKDSLGRKEYRAVVDAAPAALTRVSSLQHTVSALRAEMASAVTSASQQWQVLSAEVPEMIEAIQGRVDALSQARRPPRDLGKEGLRSAKEGLEQMKSTWSEAMSLFGAGNPVDAVSKAQAAKQQGDVVMQTLGMQSTTSEPE
jgi:hypothetical protein